MNISAPVVPLYLKERVEMIYLCGFGDIGDIHNASENNCSLIQPFLTTKGLCFTFNSLSMKEIFHSTVNLHHCESVLGFNNKSTLVQPSGSSSSNRCKIILNSFERVTAESLSMNFILSITNEHNPFDIVNRNYLIESGHSYIFKVLANQIISSEDLNKMEPNYVKCFLTNETEPLLFNLTKMYSKSSCEYECLVKTAVKECQCISWNTLELSLDNFAFCDYQNFDCIATMNSTYWAADCNCEETAFSIIKSNRLLESELDFCTDEKVSAVFPSSIFCELCQKIIAEQKIRFVYEHNVNEGPDPNDLDEFCRKFVTENVALVEVEMATESLT
jgi:hypothetical protein